MSINIQVLEHFDSIDGFETSSCKLHFTGDDVNHVVMNTIRRTILSLIPMYQFNGDNIMIGKNTSVYDNDKMRNRLSCFPVYFGKNVHQEITNMTESQLNSEETLMSAAELEYKANLGSAEISIAEQKMFEKNLDDNLMIMINVINRDENVMNVMTDDPNVKFYYKKMEIPHIYDTPLLIVKLRKNQEFMCRMVADLDIGLTSGIYQCVSICAIKENDENDYELLYSSKRQINEKDILIRACKILKNKIARTNKILASNIINANDETVLLEGEIDIEGEQHTIGNLLTHYVQKEQGIHYCGYNVGHPNINRYTMKYGGEVSIIDAVANATSKIMEIFEAIENKINGLEFGYRYF